MKIPLFTLVAVGALAMTPVLAAQWDAEKAVCADAIAAEAGVDAASYEARLKGARDGGTKRLTVSLSPRAGDGPAIVGECKVQGGVLKSVKIKA